MSDPQAKKLYAMENRFMRAAMRGTMTRSELQELADRGARRWRIEPPRVKFTSHTKYVGQSYSGERTIHLNGKNPEYRAYNGRNAPVLLHELAHYITDWKYPELDAHGPIFAAVARDLYDHFDVLPAECFDCLAKVYGVNVSDGIKAPARKRIRRLAQ